MFQAILRHPMADIATVLVVLLCLYFLDAIRRDRQFLMPVGKAILSISFIALFGAVAYLVWAVI